ncbi:Gfo/Idh/MocA family protein [Streptomyces gelaticus]|uniref:Gfo/Idh/MocA family protein n=1 Tax=Streptomyces gelaticus TaxID=285446 RepID=UPI0037A04289
MWLSPRGSNGRTVTAAFALLAAGPEYMMRAESEVSLAGKQPHISVLRPHHPHAQTEGTPVSDLRLGVIGLGLRRSIATSAHHPGQGSAITAVCDLDPEVRRREAEYFGTDVAVEDYKLLLGRDDLDAIVVATPDDTHETIVIDALRAGKAVFVEKPLGITSVQWFSAMLGG